MFTQLVQAAQLLKGRARGKKRQSQVWSGLLSGTPGSGGRSRLWSAHPLAGGLPERSWRSARPRRHLEHLWLPQHHLVVTLGACTSQAKPGVGFQQELAGEYLPGCLRACEELSNCSCFLRNFRVSQLHSPCLHLLGIKDTKWRVGEFPGSPVVRIRHFHCQGPGYDPWYGN